MQDAYSFHRQLAQGGDGWAQGIDDIDQAIRIILATPKGSDVLRPDFGSNHFDYLDAPHDVFIPNAAREIYNAIEQWEKRVVVDDVRFESESEKIVVRVYWRVSKSIADDIQRETEIKWDKKWI